jgi:hypothetical protein
MKCTFPWVEKGPVACQTFRMSAIALQLEQTLASLDPSQASALERLVRDAMDLVRARPRVAATAGVDANGWPVGHFEKYAGAFANEPFDESPDSPPEPNEAAVPW